MPEYHVHDLIRLRREPESEFDRPLPSWACSMLSGVPYIVVRRGLETAGIPVGIRGKEKKQRFACALLPEAVAEKKTPEMLLQALLCGTAGCASWRETFLPLREQLLEPGNFFPGVHSIGVTGSLGFELASGYMATTEKSDIDLLVRVDESQFGREAARELLCAFHGLGRRTDAVLETPNGWTALEEYASGAVRFLQKTADGCRLTDQL